MTTAIAIDGVSKRFRLFRERPTSLKQRLLVSRSRAEELWALRDVSFDVPDGAFLGLVGHNGSGKTTLLKCIAGILRPTAGTIRYRGRLVGLLELGAGFHQARLRCTACPSAAMRAVAGGGSAKARHRANRFSKPV